MRKGQEPTANSENSVNDMPDNFKEWAVANAEKISIGIADNKAPFFVNDNKRYVFQSLSGDDEQIDTQSSNRFTNIIKNTSNYFRSSYNAPILYSDSKRIDLAKFISTISDAPTNKDVHDVVEILCNNNNSFFKGSLKSVTIGYDTQNFMAVKDWDGRKYNNLFISTKIYDGVFCPEKELKNALVAIKKGNELTFNEEYSLECLFHEFLHSKSVGWLGEKDIAQIDRNKNIMETLNQFVARRQYVDFIKKNFTSAKLNPSTHNRIVLEGYGYGDFINNLSNVLKECKIEDNALYEHYKTRITTLSYKFMFDDLAKFMYYNQQTKYSRYKIDLMVANIAKN